MSTTGTEKHCRLCLMLTKGGTKACHGLLLKRVMELSPKDHTPYPWTVQQFLESNRKTIKKSKISKNKFNVLFPNIGDTNLSKWDLSLYCTVLMLYCEFSSAIRLDIQQFQTLRNELCHMNEPHITDIEFKDKLELIQVVIGRILEKIDNPSLKLEIENIMNSLETEPLSLGETLKEMHKFYLMEVDIREKLEHVEERVLKKLEKLDDIENKCDLISKKLDKSSSANLDVTKNNVLVPGVDIFLELKNITEDEEENISAVLCKIFEEVINEDEEFKANTTIDSHVKLREVSLKTFKIFLSKGWRIISAQHECVLLHIKCDSFKSLACLFREQSNGQIDEHLKDLKQALREYRHGKEICIETTIYKDEFWSVLENSIFSVEEFLRKCNVGPTNPGDDRQQERRHTLTLSAKNVWTEHENRDRRNDLSTCLQALKTDLESELGVQNISVKTCTWTEANPGDAGKNQHKEDKIEENESVNSSLPRTVQKRGHFSFPFKSPRKRLKMENKDQYVHNKNLSVIDIGQNIKQNANNEDNESTEEREQFPSVMASANTSTYIKEETSTNVEKEPAFPQNALHGIIEARIAVSSYLELAFLTLFDTQLQEIVSKAKREMMIALDVMKLVNDIMFIADRMFSDVPNCMYILPEVETTIYDISRRIERLRGLVLELESRIKIKKSTIQTSKKAMESYLHLQELCKNEETFSQECQQHMKNVTALYRKVLEERQQIFRSYKDIRVDISRYLLSGDDQYVKSEDAGKAKSIFQQEVMKPVKPSVSDDIQFDEILTEAETKFALKSMKSQQKQEKFPKPPSSEQTKYDYVIPFDVKPGRSDVKPGRSDVKPGHSDVKPGRSDVKPDRSDVKPGRSVVKPGLIEDFIGKDKKYTSLNEALMEMLRPGKALLSDHKDLEPDSTQKHSAGLKTLFTDPIFEDNSEFLDEVKTFYSEVIKHQEKGYTESLQLQGEQICYRCIQRMEEHLKILEVHVKRMSMVLSRIKSATDYIYEARHRLHPSRLHDFKKEWLQVHEVTHRLRYSQLVKSRVVNWRWSYDRKEELKRILKEFSSLAEYEPHTSCKKGDQSKKEIEKEKSQIVK